MLQVQVSSSKHNANKKTKTARGPFHQSMTAIFAELQKKKDKQFTEPTHMHVAVYLFWDLDRDRRLRKWEEY